MSSAIKLVCAAAAFWLAACDTQTPPQERPAKQAFGVEKAIWQKRLSPDVPYYNITGAAVSARAAPELTSPPVASVPPGGGGYIKTCTQAADWCEIGFGGDGQTGWVDMKAFGGVAT